jgi:predicted RecB family nuclease
MTLEVEWTKAIERTSSTVCADVSSCLGMVQADKLLRLISGVRSEALR